MAAEGDHVKRCISVRTVYVCGRARERVAGGWLLKGREERMKRWDGLELPDDEEAGMCGENGCVACANAPVRTPAQDESLVCVLYM